MGLFEFILATFAGTLGTAIFVAFSKVARPQDPDGASLAALVCAIKLLPPELRRDRGEEWLAYILEFEPGFERYRQALTLPLAASVIRAQKMTHLAASTLGGAISLSGKRLAQFRPAVRLYGEVVALLAEKLAAAAAKLRERNVLGSTFAFGGFMAVLGAALSDKVIQEVASFFAGLGIGQ